MITICFTYFRSLALANLRAALYSLSRQDLSQVESIVVVDNNTEDTVQEVQAAVSEMDFPVPVRLLSYKHGNSSRTHSWSTNAAVRQASTPWVLFTRADYLLDFDVVERFVDAVWQRSDDWNGFVTGNVYHLNADVGVCEGTDWRVAGPRVLRGFPGAEASYTLIDAGVWMARRAAFDQVGGLNEGLSAWGHAQTHFQFKLHVAGVEFVRIPDVLFYHPQHAAVRDLALAHQQLREHGLDIQELWARHEGAQPYR